MWIRAEKTDANKLPCTRLYMNDQKAKDVELERDVLAHVQWAHQEEVTQDEVTSDLWICIFNEVLETNCKKEKTGERAIYPMFLAMIDTIVKIVYISKDWCIWITINHADTFKKSVAYPLQDVQWTLTSVGCSWYF